MRHAGSTGISRRRLFEMTRLSAGATLLAGLPVFAEPRPSSKVEAAGATSFATKTGSRDEDKSIRPFHVSVPEEQLVDLQKRIAATRWPDKQTIS